MLVVQYRDLSSGPVDVSVLAAAERRSLATVATTDRRHFTVVRPAHVSQLAVLP
jgi:uncharacterized protein